MFAETEGFFDNNIGPSHTKRNYKKYILKQPDTEELCRRCGKESETIQHITAACEQLAPTEYVKRHDGLAKIIHQKLVIITKKKNNNNKLRLGCYPVAVVILRVYKIRNWLLINLSREDYMRSM